MKTHRNLLLLLLVRLHDQSSSSDEVGGLLQVLQAPYTFWWSGVADGHCAIRSGWCLLHLWRTCSVGWSSSPQQGHIGEGTIFSFMCMCVLSMLWSERSRAKTTWPGLSRRWYASFSCLFWWWWSFPGNGCWLMVVLLVIARLNESVISWTF